MRLLLVLLLCSVSVLGLVLDHNESVNVTLIEVNTSLLNASNITYNVTTEEFLCREVLPEDICTPVQVNLSLEPGELDRQTVGACTFQAECSFPDDDVPQKCVIDRRLEPGQIYEKNDAVCDVMIAVEQNQSARTCPDVDTVRQRFPVRVQSTTEGSISIEVNNRTFKVPTDPELFSWESEIELECPEEINIDTEQESDDLLEVCREFTPFLVNDWIRPTLEACRDDATHNLDLTKECEAKTSGLRDTIAQLQSDAAALEAKLSAQEETIAQCRADRDDSVNQANNRGVFNWLLGIYSGLVTVLLCVVSFLFYRKMRGDA